MRKIVERLKNEPAYVAGVLTAAGMAIQDAVSWEDAIPLVMAAVIRQLVTPKRKVLVSTDDREEAESSDII